MTHLNTLKVQTLKHSLSSTDLIVTQTSLYPFKLTLKQSQHIVNKIVAHRAEGTHSQAILAHRVEGTLSLSLSLLNCSPPC